MGITSLRNKIDEIDAAIITLIERRATLVAEISVIKQHEKRPIFQQERYQELKEKWTQWAQQLKLPQSYLLELFETIHRHSLQSQLTQRTQLLDAEIAFE